MAEKKCTYCHQVKQETAFRQRLSRGKAVLTVRCVECLNRIARDKYKSDPALREKAKARSRAKALTPEGREYIRKKSHERTLQQRQEERRCSRSRQGKQYRTLEQQKQATAQRNKVDKRILWPSNAGQAWRYWLLVRAPDWWIKEYFAALGCPWRNQRLSSAERYKLRYQTDIDFQISERIRRQVKKAACRDGVAELIRAALYRDGTSPQAERLLGYSIAQLKRHIERQFVRGMSWPKFMRGLIHIDHITPKAAFDLSDDKEWRACWSLSNLQPLWQRDNLDKRDNITKLL